MLRWSKLPARLVVAGLEVQVLDVDGRVAAPVAAEDGVAADQVQGARDDVAVAPGPSRATTSSTCSPIVSPMRWKKSRVRYAWPHL